jgi:LysB family phage lysis regulatory protein
MGIRAYIALAVLLAFTTLGGVALYYRAEAADAAKEAQQAISDRDTAVAANKAQEATIGRLRASAEANDKLLAKMADDIAGIHNAAQETNDEIGKLRDENQEVRDYLGVSVPDSVKRVLDR